MLIHMIPISVLQGTREKNRTSAVGDSKQDLYVPKMYIILTI